MSATRELAASCLIAWMALGGAARADGPDIEQGSAAGLPASDAAPLQAVVVTATASERDAADAPASISSIDGASLRRRPLTDLADAVTGTVGLAVDSVGRGRRGISIRGMSSEHTLMLVDGQRISSSASIIAHSDFELGWVPSEAIERVEVVRGPLSALYGSEALGGVINIITRAATDHWQGSFSSYALINDHGQDGDQYKTGFYVGGPLLPGKLGVNAWGEYRHRDALQDAGNAALTALDRQRARSAHVGLTWTPDSRQRIDFAVDANNEDQHGRRQAARARAYEIDNDVQRRRYAVSHAGMWDWGSSQLRLYRSTLNRVVRRSDGADPTGPNRFTDTVLDGRVSFGAGQIHKLSLGAETRRERLEDPSINRAGRKAQTHYAVFVQDEIFLSDRWELVLGSRFDHHADFGWEVSPRAYLLFHPSAALTLRGGMGRGFKAPTLKQLSPEFESRAAMGGRAIVRGNPELEPETNRAFELGAAYDVGTWSASATLFHNDVRNLIDTVRQPTCFEPGRICLDYENVAKVRLQGLELSATVALDPQWRVDANYTYLEARDRGTDTRLPDRSRHRANATLAWMPRGQLSTRLRAEHVGAQYRAAGLRERPGYTLLHWYVDYELGPGFALHAGVENLGDKRLANDDVDLYGRADEGRRYFAGLTATF